ncbi:MAG: hypothetical protein GF400_05940 [Candidatus Eisenbacteria bacterium]|nr:hypothetical protein [Candidatus Eisenbacteria bacterium]
MSEQPRPVNPLAALTLVIVFPRQTFRRLKRRPNWVVPLVFIVAAVIAKSLLSLESGVLDEVLRAEAMRTGVDIDVVRSGAPVAFAMSGVVGVPVVILLQSLFFMAVGRVFGGYCTFRTSLSTIAYASVPVGVGALAAAALLPLTHSPDLGADLSRFVDPATRPFLWGVARELGVVPIWFYVLVGIAASPVLGLGKRRARLATLTFAVVHIMIMSWLGVSEARSQEDPLESWLAEEGDHAVVHVARGTEPSVAREAAAAADSLAARVGAILGELPERIDCYVYSSVGEKERLTGNAALAHGVTWASAVHVAWEGEREVALARELAKVAGAEALGKMYNPFLGDGLALYAGGRWGGRAVGGIAAGLHADSELPGLRELVDPAGYDLVGERSREVAAGSFTAFLIDEMGLEGYRDFYSRVARTRVPLADALEQSLGDSLGGVEDDWMAYVARGHHRRDGRSTD